MGYLKYVRDLWKKPKENMPEAYKQLLYSLRREPATMRIEKPTNIAKARTLGYKAKKGIIIVRQRVFRGGRQRPDIKGGRRSAHSYQRKEVSKNYQQVAEERVSKQYTNCAVLNSYKLAQDGKYYWFEIILLDRTSPDVMADKRLAGVAEQRGRAERGLTSAGRKARGLYKKGIGSEKTRPSLGANKKLGN